MIDLHCHLLPGLDDGAGDLDDALAMARVAEADGIEAICATPHIRHDHDVRVHELAGHVAALNDALGDAGIAVQVLPGGEVAETALEGLDDDELRTVSLASTGRWVLLEPAPGPLSDSLEHAVEHLGERGCRALIAHPERHLAEDVRERLERLVARGALVQATAAMFLHPQARSGMLKLASAGLVHVVASDSHSSFGGRPLELRAAIDVLRTVEPTASNIGWVVDEAPRAIVEGREVEVPW